MVGVSFFIAAEAAAMPRTSRENSKTNDRIGNRCHNEADEHEILGRGEISDSIKESNGGSQGINGPI